MRFIDEFARKLLSETRQADIEACLQEIGSICGAQIDLRIDRALLLVAVRDRGPGLADTTRIFDKFYRGDGARPGGLGLGLPISRGLIQALGGTLEARNREGGGAEFLARIPVETESRSLHENN